MKLTASQSTGLGAGALFYCSSTHRFLFCLRSAICDAPNTWCNVGGGVEDGESIIEGILRECEEEIGIRPDCHLFPLHVNTLVDPETQKVVFTYHNFLGIVAKEFKCLLNDEHDAYRWCPGHDLPLPLHPEFRKALASPRAQALLNAIIGD